MFWYVKHAAGVSPTVRWTRYRNGSPRPGEHIVSHNSSQTSHSALEFNQVLSDVWYQKETVDNVKEIQHLPNFFPDLH